MNDSTHNYLVSCFLGIQFKQYYIDMFPWEKFFSDFQVRFDSVFELGTLYGGFSLFLKLLCVQYRKEFKTFDNIQRSAFDSPIQTLVSARQDFFLCDIFENDGALIKSLVTHPLVLFCDNGNKREEVELFSSELLSGDFLVVHDWMVEIFPKDIPENCKSILWETCEDVQSLTRFFEVT